MNKILSLTKTRYLFYVEDDWWVFHDKPLPPVSDVGNFLWRAMEVLRNSAEQVSQVRLRGVFPHVREWTDVLSCFWCSTIRSGECALEHRLSLGGRSLTARLVGSSLIQADRFTPLYYSTLVGRDHSHATRQRVPWRYEWGRSPYLVIFQHEATYEVHDQIKSVRPPARPPTPHLPLRVVGPDQRPVFQLLRLGRHRYMYPRKARHCIRVAEGYIGHLRQPIPRTDPGLFSRVTGE